MASIPTLPSVHCELLDVARRFVREEVLPAERVFERELAAQTDGFASVPPVLEQLKARARELGLWNLFIPKEEGGRLTNVEYAHFAEAMGWSPLASEACNCSAPDTGNMEILLRYGSPSQRRTWLQPLLKGEIRSAFLMTEPEVASSDARNIQTRIERDGDEYVITGRKWWATGAMNPHCAVYFVMGKTDPMAGTFQQHSIVLVARDTPGVRIVRPLTAFGYDDAPEGHAEVILEGVRVPASNILGGEGRGFEIAQSRLGPGRIHHCMRAIGLAERAYELMLQRSTDPAREVFGRRIAEHATTQADIAECRILIDAARLMVLHAAHLIDTVGQKAARSEISAIKVFVPRCALKVVDTAIQVHGAAGVSPDFPLARIWAGLRTLRIADGPDIVHLRTVAMLEIKRYAQRAADRDSAGAGAARPRL